jgi:hypothetical protein
MLLAGAACLWACLPIRSFTPGSQLRDELEPVHVVAALEVLDPLFDRLDEPSALPWVEIFVLGGRSMPAGRCA